MTHKKRDVEAALQRKGFEKSEGDHAYFVYLRAKDGKKTSVFTKTSHGSGNADIGDHLVSKMAKQCKLAKKDFDRLVQCHVSRDEYERLLTASGVAGLQED